MLGGEWFGELFGNPDEVSEDLITEVALKELRNQLGIVKQPSTVLSRIHKVSILGRIACADTCVRWF